MISALLLLLLKVLRIVLLFAIYPINAIIQYIKIAKSSDNVALKFFKTFITSFTLAWWCGLVFTILLLANVLEVLFMGGSVVALLESGEIDVANLPTVVEEDDGNTNTSSSSNGAKVSNINGMYIIDMSTISDSTTVSLSSGTYQNGTVKQRAEILTIVQEICARPEITITPQQLLGTFFTECNATISCSGSVIDTVFEATPNAWSCAGPFQINTQSWEITGNELQGRAFISSLEDPNLTDDQRVQTASTCSKTIEGHKRPYYGCFSDAAYTCALYQSRAVDAATTYFHWSDDAENFIAGLGGTSEQIAMARYVAGISYYSGYSSDCKTYLIPMYFDMMKAYGDLTQWYALGNRASYRTKNNEIMDTLSRTTGDLSPGSGTYYNTYKAARASGTQQSYEYPFFNLNGGKWVYEGLVAMAEELGAEYEASQSEASSNLSVSDQINNLVSYAESLVGNSTFPLTGGGTSVSSGYCARFVRCVAYFGAGVTINYGNGNQYPQDHAINYKSDGTVDWSVIPIGVCVVSDGTGSDGAKYGHVALYVGNGQIIEAGGSTIRKTSIDNMYHTNKIIGWGYLSGINYTNSNNSNNQNWNVIYSLLKQQIGKPYVYGSAGPSSFDCSGLVYYVYRETGIAPNIARTAQAQFNSSTRISESQLTPGDLVFYSFNNSTSSVDHVAIYIGNNKVIHAPTTGQTVCEHSINMSTSQPIVGYGRVN